MKSPYLTNYSSHLQIIPSLNGLRALSVIIVLLGHIKHLRPQFMMFGNNADYKYSFINILVQPFLDGAMGVNVFFIISGFLITSLLIKEKQKYQTIQLKNFYIRRALRIFPAFYFMMVVYFLLQRRGIIHLSTISWITSLTYTKFFFNNDWLTMHLWSLSVEEWFYLIWPFVFLRGSLKKQTILLFAIIFLCPFVRASSIYFPDINTDPKLSIFRTNTLLSRSDALAIGCLIGLYLDKIIRYINSFKFNLSYIAFASIFLIPFIKYAVIGLKLPYFQIELGHLYGFCANIFLSIIIIFSVFGAQNYWYKLLNSRVLDYIGKLSYGIYLWQQFCLSEDWLIHFTPLPLNIIFIFLLAIFSYYIIEQPLLKLKNKLSVFKI